MMASRLSIATLIAFLWLSAALPYPFATIILDIVRDLNAAAAVAYAGDWPLRGPVINNMFHLGPGWFYVLAVPLGLTGSIPVTLFLVGCLAGSKFLFAYLCGRRLHSTTFGLLWAVGLAFPGWSALSSLIVTHTSLVEASILATAWAALRVHDRGRLRDWLLLGAFLAVAFHAHPSTIAAAPLLATWAIVRLQRGWRHELLGWLACLLPVVCALLPSAVAEWREGWPAFSAVGAYAAGNSVSRGGLLELAFGAHVSGAAMVTDALAAPASSLALKSLCIAVAAIAAGGLLRALLSPARIFGIVLFAGYATALIIVWLLRDTTPFYMVLVLLPFASALWALGLSQLYCSRGRPLVLAAVLVTIVLGSVQNGLLIVRAEQGLIALRSEQISNVRQHHAAISWHATLPAFRLGQLAKSLCRPGLRVLHTELAALVDAALALPARLRCGNELNVGVGGGADLIGAQHLLGLTPGWLRRSGISPDAGWSDTRRLSPSRVIAAANTQSVPDGSLYPFRRRTRQPSVHSWRFSAAPEQTVFVAHLYIVYDAAHTVAVRANGRIQQPLFQTSTTSAWRCDGCDSPVTWEVVAKADVDRIDIVLAAPFYIDSQVQTR
jgi:hypothetical protein